MTFYSYMKKTILFIVIFLNSFAFSQHTENVVIDWNSNVQYKIGESIVNVPQFDYHFFDFYFGKK